MPQDLNPDPIVTLWEQLQALPLDDQNEPLEFAPLRTALKRLLDNDVMLERRSRRFSFNWEGPIAFGSAGSYFAGFVGSFNLSLSNSQRLRVVRGLFSFDGSPNNDTLAVGFRGISNPGPVSVPGLTPYLPGTLSRETLDPINHFCNNAGHPNFGGNTTVVVEARRDNGGTFNGRVMLEFDVVDV